MKFNADLDAETARSLFHYDPETGDLTWKISPARCVKAGSRAGAFNTSGHRQVLIKRRAYVVHRLVWLMTYGRWPKEQIDHINGDRSDNSLANLREASHVENSRNRAAQSNNACGVKGVHRKGKRYNAQIQFNGKIAHLGVFDTVEEAAAAYRDAALKHFGHFARV